MQPFIRKFIALFAIVVMIALSTGCAGGNTAAPASGVKPTGGPASDSTSSQPGPGGQTNGPAHPVSVSASLDTSAQVRALVPEKGGQITASLENGLVYTLSIPEGALLSDQEVTMTPIRSLDGMPLSGGLIAGVQLEPDGTQLMKPATLTISAPQGYDLRHMVGFGYHAQGQGFYLAPASGDGKTITLQIMSFSGHGAGTGSDQDVNNQAGQSTGSAEDDLIQQMTQLLQDAKAHGKDMPDTAKMVELMKDFYDKTVKPTLQNAAKDDGQIDAAAAMYLRWWKNAALLGLEGDLQSRIDEGLNLLIKGLKNAFDKAAKRCVDNQNINESENMLKRLRQLALLGGDTGGYTLDGKQAEFQRCVRYKLNLDSMITWEMATNMNITTQVTSSTTLKMDTSEGAMILFRGKGTLQHKNYSIEWTGESAKMNDLCKIQTETKDGTLEAVGRVVWYNLSSKDPKQSTVIAVKPSFLDERMPQWKCDTDVNGGFIQMNVPFSLPLWGAGFDSVHKDIKGSLEGLSDAYLFVDFDYVGGQVVARLAQSKSATVSDAKVTDDITMDVMAAPGAD